MPVCVSPQKPLAALRLSVRQKDADAPKALIGACHVEAQAYAVELLA